MEQDPDIDPTRPPSGTGCAGCLAAGSWWFHLRRCARCGEIGCCDSSPEQHARRHWEATGHAVIASFEPGEDWLWDFRAGQYVDGPELAPPRHRPPDQPVPGPAGRVPPDWAARLRR